MDNKHMISSKLHMRDHVRVHMRMIHNDSQ